ncbi:MAG: elongation factor P [Candidatus Pacebacteria bacterium]|nr:elongation factor P [Candidatus Paceibacterota bacterium]
MISTTQFKNGMILKIDDQPWMIAEHQFVSPGKGGAFTRVKIKNLKTGKFVERTFKSGEEFDEVELDRKPAVYLYSDRRNSVFLEKSTNQRISLPLESTQDKIQYIKPNTEVNLVYIEGKLISVDIPIKVELKVIEAPPSFKGDTATGGLKKVKLETGLEINVPVFIEAGEVIRINTETGEYVERAN